MSRQRSWRKCRLGHARCYRCVCYADNGVVARVIAPRPTHAIFVAIRTVRASARGDARIFDYTHRLNGNCLFVGIGDEAHEAKATREGKAAHDNKRHLLVA